MKPTVKFILVGKSKIAFRRPHNPRAYVYCYNSTPLAGFSIIMIEYHNFFFLTEKYDEEFSEWHSIVFNLRSIIYIAGSTIIK